MEMAVGDGKPDMDALITEGHEIFCGIQSARLGAGRAAGEKWFDSSNSHESTGKSPLERFTARYCNILRASTAHTHSPSIIPAFTQSLATIIEFATLFLPEFDQTSLSAPQFPRSPADSLFFWHRTHVKSERVGSDRLASFVRKILHGECAEASAALAVVLREMAPRPETHAQALASSFPTIARVLETFPAVSEEDSRLNVPSIKSWQASLGGIGESVSQILDELRRVLHDHSSVLTIVRQAFAVLSGKSTDALRDIVEYAGLDRYWFLCGHTLYFSPNARSTEALGQSTEFLLRVEAPAARGVGADSLAKFIAAHGPPVKLPLAESPDSVCLDAIVDYANSMGDGTKSTAGLTSFVLERLFDWFCESLATQGGAARSSIDERLRSTGILKDVSPLDGSPEAQTCYGILMWVCVHWAHLIIDPLHPYSVAFSEAYDSMVLELLRFIHSTASPDLQQDTVKYFCTYLLDTPTLSKSVIFEEMTAEIYAKFHDNDEALVENVQLLLELFGPHSAVQSIVCSPYGEILDSQQREEWENARAYDSASLCHNVEHVLILQVAQHVCLGAHAKVFAAISNYFHLAGVSGKVSFDSFYLLLGVLGAFQHRSTAPGLLFEEVFCTNLQVEGIIAPNTIGPSEDLCRAFLCIFGEFCFETSPTVLDGYGERAFVELCQSAFFLEKRMLEINDVHRRNTHVKEREMIPSETSAFDEYLSATLKSCAMLGDRELATCAETVLQNEFVPRSYRVSLLERLLRTFHSPSMVSHHFTSAEQYPSLVQMIHASSVMIQAHLLV